MSRWLNWLGQLRIYSFVDLLWLGAAAGAGGRVWLGAALLWIGFLIQLERTHQDGGRARFPLWPQLACYGIGLWLFPPLYALGLLLASLFYSWKKQPDWGWSSSLWRGLQNYLMVAAVTGPEHWLAHLAGWVTALRNLFGDCRDLEKDRSEGLHTLPIELGLYGSWPWWTHLAGVMATSLLWWHLSDWAWPWLVATWLIQLATYRLTPR